MRGAMKTNCDEVCVVSCGGAGWGRPKERNQDLMRLNVEQGFISTQVAAEVQRSALFRTLMQQKDTVQ